jgi:hypothetical protein
MIILTGLLGTAVAMVLIIGYVKRVDHAAEVRNVERQRQICGLIVLLDERNRTLPPATDPATARFRSEIHTYRVELGCP